MMGLLTKSLEAMKCDRSQPGGIGTNELLPISYAYMVWFAAELCNDRERLMEEYDLSK